MIVHTRFAFWIIYLILAIHLTFSFHLLGEHGSLGMFIMYGILPLGYIISIPIFEKREK
jgi:hypothetical protein